MKLLLDTCMSPVAAGHLRHVGHDVVWSGDWPTDPGDDEILQHAYEQGRVLITLDKDFGELAIRMNARHNGIVRLDGFRASEQGRVCETVLAQYGNDLQVGAIITVSPGRVRIRTA